MHGRWRLSILAAALLTGAPLRAQRADSTPVAVRAVTYEVSARYRPRLATSTADGDEPARWEYERLRLQGRIGLWGHLFSRVQLDYDAGEWSVDDAWVRLRTAGDLEITAGQLKRPFTVISMRSGSQVGPVSRGASIRGVGAAEEQNLVNDLEYGDRAIGLQVGMPIPGASPDVRVEAGIFPFDAVDAPLALGDAQASARVTARVASRVVMGGAVTTRRLREEEEGPPGERTVAAGVDLEVGDDVPGVHLLAEWVAGEAGHGEWFRGGHAWLMYRTGERGPAHLTFEPLLRWSASGGVTAEEGAGTLLTPGLNVYVGDPDRWNRVMLNYDVWNPRGDGKWEHSFKVQFSVGV